MTKHLNRFQVLKMYFQLSNLIQIWAVSFFRFCHVCSQCSQETHSKFKISIWLCFTLYVFDVTTFWVAQYRHLMCSTVDPDHQLLCIEETLFEFQYSNQCAVVQVEEVHCFVYSSWQHQNYMSAFTLFGTVKQHLPFR